MVIGQEKLCEMIYGFSPNTFPRVVMLVGERGAGKTSLLKEICNHFMFPNEDITDSLSYEKIEAIYQSAEPTIYSIRINELSVREENLILKFLEEPLKNSYIVLLATSDMGVLPTVMSRCILWQLSHYTKRTLKEFLPADAPELILEVARTPGMVIKFSEADFNGMYELANRVIDKIGTSYLSNALTITDRMAFKNEKDKYDIDLFVYILHSLVAKRVHTDTSNKYLDAYFLTSTLLSDFNVDNVDKRYLFEKYIVELREIIRGEK